MTNKQKRNLYKILTAAVLFILGSLINQEGLKLAIFLVAYLIVGLDVLKKAGRNLITGQMLDENFLMSIATIGAFIIGEYPEGVAVMIFYKVGDLFENYAVGKSRKSIASLMDIRPDYANIKRDGEIIKVDPTKVSKGETIIIKPGEKIPLDGSIISGATSVNLAALTGESMPQDLSQGDKVISGGINLTGVIEVLVSSEFGESTVSKILNLVENAASKKSKSENFITRFARVYTPLVVAGAVILAVLPSIILGDWQTWIYRALVFLVVSCPCALVISVPLSFFGGIGGASKNGILIKGSNYLELLGNTQTIVFDKTGTLTKGNFKVENIYTDEMPKEEVLKLAAVAEYYSSHPISISIKKEAGENCDITPPDEITEVAGHGVKAMINGEEVLCGNYKLMAESGIICEEKNVAGTMIYLAKNGKYLAGIEINDEIKDDSAVAIKELKSSGVNKVVMLTGDNKIVADYIAKKAGITDVFAELLPADKVDVLEKLLSEQTKGKAVAFVGDGINDAAVLSRADVGIAMGALGSDAAIEAADIVLMNDNPRDIVTAIKIAKKTCSIVKQNIVFALGVKAIVLILSVVGVANMWLAVFADVGVSIIAILNAMRAAKIKK